VGGLVVDPWILRSCTLPDRVPWVGARAAAIAAGSAGWLSSEVAELDMLKLSGTNVRGYLATEGVPSELRLGSEHVTCCYGQITK
jgi:hypothetical protein